jgi:hypothetical protein
MTWSLVGSAGAVAQSSVSPLTVNCGQASTSGNLLVLLVHAAGNVTPPSPPAGWSAALAAGLASTNNGCWAFAYFNNPGSISSISLTISTTTQAQIVEYTCPNVALVTAVDQIGQLTNTTPVSPFNLVTSGNLAANHELAVSCGSMRNGTANASTVAAGAGFTQDGQQGSGVSGTYHTGFDHELDTGSSAGATVTDAMAFSITGTGNECGVIVTFAQPSARPSPVVITAPPQAAPSPPASSPSRVVRVAPVLFVGAATLTGSGTLTGSPVFTGTATLTGSGTLGAAPGVGGPLPLVIQGPARPAPPPPGPPRIIGTPVSTAFTRTATLSGSGTLSAAPVFTGTATLSGSGTLTASPVFTVAATLSGSGTLTGSYTTSGGGATPSDSDASNPAAEAVPYILLRSYPLAGCGDWTNAAQPGSATIFATDAGTFTDAGTVGTGGSLVLGTDAGTGLDAGESVRVFDGDAAIITELLQWSVGVNDADTGLGTETAKGGKQIIGTDTGTGTEAVLSLFPEIQDSDAGTGTDAGLPANATVTDSDSLTGTESIGGRLKNDTDAGIFTEQNFAGPLDGDIGTGDDEQASPAAVARDTDVGVFYDNQFLLVGGIGRVAGEDSGKGAEAASVMVLGLPLPTGPAPAFESFSVSHAAILAGTGTEVQPLFAVRSGQVSLRTSSVSSLSDDQEIATWNVMIAADVSVTGGFIPYSTIALLVSAPVSSQAVSGGTAWSQPLYVQQMLAGLEVPLYLAATSRNALGARRALQIVLYRVRISTVQAAPAAYKEGLTVTFTGTALPSGADEAGNSLADLEIGRMAVVPDPSGSVASTIVASPAFGQGS